MTTSDNNFAAMILSQEEKFSSNAVGLRLRQDDPAWYVQQTGGGCTAWQLDVGESRDRYLMISDDGSSCGDSVDEPFYAGIYEFDSGDQIACGTYQNLEQAIVASYFVTALTENFLDDALAGLHRALGLKNQKVDWWGADPSADEWPVDSLGWQWERAGLRRRAELLDCYLIENDAASAADPNPNEYAFEMSFEEDGFTNLRLLALGRDDLDAALGPLQECIGIETGDFAAVWWSGPNEEEWKAGDHNRRIQLLGAYLAEERQILAEEKKPAEPAKRDLGPIDVATRLPRAGEDGKPHPETVQTLARAFVGYLFASCSAGQFARVRRTNVALKDTTSCASHDVCDANMVMAEAFEDILGRPCIMPDDIEEGRAASGEEDLDMGLWNAAWDVAKRDWLTEGGAHSFEDCFAAYEELA